MEISNMTLSELCLLREKLIKDGLDFELITELILNKEQEYIDYLLEDGPGGAAAAASIGVGGGGVAYANATIGGAGPVISSQPSSFVGATTEPAYSAGGGKNGSGDLGNINVAYNPGGRKKVFQKISAPMDNMRGTNKRRRNKMIRGLKNIFANKQDWTHGQSEVKGCKIASFDNFQKEKINKVTKVDK